jgi:uncharacterized protein (TIGR03437 family)
MNRAFPWGLSAVLALGSQMISAQTLGTYLKSVGNFGPTPKATAGPGIIPIGSPLTFGGTNAPDTYMATTTFSSTPVVVDNGAVKIWQEQVPTGPSGEWDVFYMETTSGGPLANNINASWNILMNYFLSAPVDFDGVVNQWLVNGTAVSPITNFGTICCAATSNPILPGASYYNNAFSAPIPAGTYTGWQETFVQPYNFVSAGGINPNTANEFIFALHFTLQGAITAVENAANFQVKSSANPAAANSLISVYVSSLGSISGSNIFPATSFQGVEVLFNGVPAPLYYVNGAVNLINLAVPSNLPTTGAATVTVQTPSGTTSGFTLPLGPTDTGVFRLSADPAHPNQGAVTISNSQWLVIPASTAAVYGLKACTGLSPASICGQPAAPGSSIVIYLTGGGLATPNGAPSGQPVATGSVAPANGSTVYDTVQTPTVTIGGLSAPVSFSGIAPGTAAEYQINTTIPNGVQAGDSVPVVVTFGSISDTVTISVQ